MPLRGKRQKSSFSSDEPDIQLEKEIKDVDVKCITVTLGFRLDTYEVEFLRDF